MHVTYYQQVWGGEEGPGAEGTAAQLWCLYSNLEDEVGINGEEQSLGEGTGTEIHSTSSPACLWGANIFRLDLQALSRKTLRHPE